MAFLVKLYEENSKAYTSFGLTQEECRDLIYESMQELHITWAWDGEEEEDREAVSIPGGAASSILLRLIKWGWLKSDYDERLNSSIISFPEYSLLYVELFQKLSSEDDSRERESILSIYSALFTYHSDQEKNNEILKGALRTSKSLGQLLSNMQDGMRSYFEELSGRKNFIGIQEVLIEEINNSDSRKYAILTTTDSFYRYKEAVKELICRILDETDRKKIQLYEEKGGLVMDSAPFVRNERMTQYCDEAILMINQIDREFDLIELKYNKLIEQKAVFAQRALARIHYILNEGFEEESRLVTLINMLDQSGNQEEILNGLRDKMKFTTQYYTMNDGSLYQPRERSDNVFKPAAVAKEAGRPRQEMTDFVPKPLYSRKELMEFKKKNMQGDLFTATEHTVTNVEDLEKLLFLWQEATESRQGEDQVTLGEELTNQTGFTFTGLSIVEEEHA